MDLPLQALDPSILDNVYRRIQTAVTSITCYGTGATQVPQDALSWLRSVASHTCTATSQSWMYGRESWVRQSLSIFCLTTFTSLPLYFVLGFLCYKLQREPQRTLNGKHEKRQIWSEIRDSTRALLWTNLFSVPIFLAQVHGYSRLYKIGAFDLKYEFAQYPLFILFSDGAMYYLHRMFHHPYLFRRVHKTHHHYVLPTPFASHAFHPVEALVMSLPVYAYSFLLPMSDVCQLSVLGLSFAWTFFLHDSRERFHAVHHQSIGYNFGQFFPLFDKLGGTYINPEQFFALKKCAQKS